MVGAICLGSTGNIQGSYEFLNLCTSKKITCHKQTVLLIPQDVIDCINQLGKIDGQPKLLTFFDCKGSSVNNSEGSSPADTPAEFAGVPAKEQAEDPPTQETKPTTLGDSDIQVMPKDKQDIDPLPTVE